MPTSPHWLRAARRLHDLYRNRAAQAAEHTFLRRMSDLQPATSAACNLLRQATASPLAGTLLARRQLRRLMQRIHDIVSQTEGQLGQTAGHVPAVRDLLADFRQLEDEFGALHLDLRRMTLAITTEEIELEDVHLGPFRIRLTCNHLARDPTSGCFVVEALDPHPAASNHDVTHPHVKAGTLCAGEAAVPIRRALEQGRLADAFCLVHGVLTTYNSASPHVSLERWHGSDCHECGCGTDADDLARCADCRQGFCGDCIGRCYRCQERCCNECLESCRVRDVSVCSGCRRLSNHSARACCQGCLATCATCGTEVGSDELDEQQRCLSCTPANQPPATDQPPNMEIQDEPVSVALPAP